VCYYNVYMYTGQPKHAHRAKCGTLLYSLFMHSTTQSLYAVCSPVIQCTESRVTGTLLRVHIHLPTVLMPVLLSSQHSCAELTVSRFLALSCSGSISLHTTKANTHVPSVSSASILCLRVQPSSIKMRQSCAQQCDIHTCIVKQLILIIVV
jgi:hypothetical protein